MSVREEACDRLDTMIAEGRVIRFTWTTRDADGKERACLLAALAPECGIQKGSSYCPAEVLPAWLAYLTPLLDDKGTPEAWPSMVREYARLVRASAYMTPEQWSRLDYRFRRICVADAAPNAACDPTCAKVIADVLALLDRQIAGDAVPPEQWNALEAAAWGAASRSRTLVVEHVTRIAAAVLIEAENAASNALSRVVMVASNAAFAIEAEACDRLTAALFAAWQDEINTERTAP